MRRDEIALLEELNFNAWPALRTVHYDGWLLRSSGGTTRRPNSVNSLRASVIALEEKIEAAERIYERWGRPAVFRMTPLADEALEHLLETRGYAVEGATFVQTAELPARYRDASVTIFPHADAHWIAAASRLRALSEEESDVFAAQHRAIGVQTGWAIIAEGGEALAVGAVGIERGWAGLHGIYVASSARRRGLGACISEALLAYAYEKGARRAWLQVEQTNAPALRAYGRFGFATAYTYHYRSKPEQRR